MRQEAYQNYVLWLKLIFCYSTCITSQYNELFIKSQMKKLFIDIVFIIIVKFLKELH